MHCELESTSAALLFSEVNTKAVERRTFFRAQLDDHAPRDVHMSNIATAMHLHEFKRREACNRLEYHWDFVKLSRGADLNKKVPRIYLVLTCAMQS